MEIKDKELIKTDLKLADSDITYYPNFLSPEEIAYYFQQFLKTVPWQQEMIRVYGKVHPQPRLTALFGNNDRPYTYSNVTMRPLALTRELLEIKQKIDNLLSITFTSCLLNRYRHGRDSNGWHADNERELGRHPIIASLSLGQERQFQLKHRTIQGLKHKILLQSGSLLVMKGETQHTWLHCIPKTTKLVGERINLTFRIIN